MRLVRVLRKELQESKRSLFIYGITIVLFFFVQEVGGAFLIRLSGGSIRSNADYLGNFVGFLFLGGFIITSIIFSEDMFSRVGQHNWLMLPASRLEKFLAKGLLTAIAYPIALALLFTVASVVVEALALLFFGNPFTMFNPLTRTVGGMLLHYVATQSIFLLGATYFRKTHFIKTVLSIGVIGIILGIVATIFFRIIFAPYFTGPYGFNFSIESYGSFEQMNIIKVGKWVGTIVYWFIMPLFCWFTAYLRVKEVEATDAIQ